MKTQKAKLMTGKSAIKITGKAKDNAKAAKAAKSGESLTYRNNEQMRVAFLFNARKLDVVSGGQGIKRGQIVKGVHGYCVAQCDVAGAKAEIVAYKANGKVTRDGKSFLEVMHAEGLNYAVHRTANGKLVNVELDRFAGQTKANRVSLVS